MPGLIIMPYRVIVSVIVLASYLSVNKLVHLLDTANGYGSKVACSLYFLQNRTLDHIYERELAWPPVGLFVNLKAQHAEKCIISRTRILAGWNVRKACLSGDDRFGCALVKHGRELDKHVFVKRPKSSVRDDEAFVLSTNLFIHRIIDEHFVDQWLNARAFLVVNASTYPATILVERYGDSADASTAHAGWSMTKSILGMLVGALMKAKPEFFPHGLHTKTSVDGATVEQLLRMVDGLDWDEVYMAFSNPVDMLFASDNITEPRRRRAPLGQCNRYSSKTSNLLSGWIRSLFKNNEEYLDFPFRLLFDKIGARTARLETDPAGTFVTSSFSLMTARDWARLGVLLAQEGQWDGDEIISKDYIRMLRSVTPTSRGLYGMHFWLGGNQIPPEELEQNKVCDRLFPSRFVPSREWFRKLPKESFFMTGFEGQYVLVLPHEKLVLVRLGASREQMPGWKSFAPFDLFGPVLQDVIKTADAAQAKLLG